MPVWLRAHASSCNGDTNMTGFGYSVESSPFITWGTTNYDIDEVDYRLSSPGTYVVHFKAWSKSGECPTVDSNVTVTGPTTSSNTNADADGDWKWVFDTGTKGSASGSMNYPVASPSQDSQSRQFNMTYTNGGGMRGSTSFGVDINANHFIYDTYIYLPNPGNVQNIEMDTNQVYDSSYDVIILGLQCAAGSKTWEYTTIDSTGSHWTPSGQACNPQTWQANVWHHVQLITHRSGGTAYYDSVILDGKKVDLNVSGSSHFLPSPHWTPLGNLVLNFQLDGAGSSGSITAYTDGMTMIWWQQ